MLRSHPLHMLRSKGYGVGHEEQFTALQAPTRRLVGRRVGHDNGLWVPDGVDELDEWDFILAEDLGEDASAQKTFEDTLYYHAGFQCFSLHKPTFTPMRKINATVAGAKELKARFLILFLM